MSEPVITRPARSWPVAAVACVVLLVLTVGQLLVATFFASGLEQFEGKGFGARLVLYPAMMLAVPVIWWFVTTRRQDPPWAAFAWIMLPYLIDVTGNTLDLYDSLVWWDDANHFVNWMFLGLGTGLLITRGERGRARPGWEIVLLVAGVGAIMAIFWEVGEYYAFIRGGTELDTAYTDTLGDEVLGTLGAMTAGAITAWRTSRRL
ncbi:hypothetical protein LWF15_16770 [Kineosporia rhizophila]|uniref:hypothetical protein n=1 Tax=Kineosporia TaxID=49184 RepID=UPI001E4555E3|nr:MULTISPECIES: hypothetical protein [Kineosporia]MCE0537156.1 hypothetical protein [Kineosporia rhizophila]GLY15996.1 hypothetical protein Kisp01_30110 [Kineosporia sp. NBRC 101677]